VRKRRFLSGGGLALVEGVSLRWREAVPYTERAVPHVTGAFRCQVVCFRRKLLQPASLTPDYRPKRPFYHPNPYLSGRPPPHPFLARVIETVLNTPFALYYAD
jgi:hypothetical protein